MVAILRGKSLAKEILFVAGAGTLLVSSFFAPNAAQLLKPLLRWHKRWDNIEQRRIKEAIQRLNQRRLAQVVQKGDEQYLEVTEMGKKYIKKFAYETLRISQPSKWDKRWRIIIFDIPKHETSARNAFREKLRELGFYPFQKSVFVYPFDCQDEIDFTVECLDLGKYVNYLVATSLHNREGEVRKYFGLPLNNT